MKKHMIFITIITLLFTSIPFTVNANTDIDYNLMGEYDGFAKAAYESYVTNSAYVAAKYTDNLGYVDGIIEQAKQNARFFWDEFKNEECANNADCNWGIEFYKKLLAGATTAIDFIKNFFSSEDEKKAVPNYDYLENYLVSQGYYLAPRYGYTLLVRDNLGVVTEIEGTESVNNSLRVSGYNGYARLQINISGSSKSVSTANIDILYTQIEPYLLNPNTITRFMHIVNIFGGVSIGVKKNDTGEEIDYKESNPNFHQINNYIQNNDNIVNPNYKPSINAEMVCSNITMNLQIVGADLKLNDEILDVNKTTGQTVYNGENCVVNFTATMPQVTEDNRIVTSNGDGTVTDVETNEIIDSNGNVVEEIVLPECDGVLCWLTNIFKHIASIPMAIISGLLDGLTGLLKALFVPSADSFNVFINELNTTMSEKFNLTAFTSVFNEMTPNSNARSVGPATTNVFDGVTVSGLMGTGEVKIIDSTTINAMLPTIHSWIKGFFYVLLAFFNINHLYKLIRGTTIFESMRGKSE